MSVEDGYLDRVDEIRLKMRLYFGVGAVGEVKKGLKGVKRVGVVTGKRSYRVSGAWDVVRRALEEMEVEYAHYDGIRPNPEVSQMNEGAETLREIDPEMVIGIGGGSPLDSAKVIAVLLRSGGRSAEELFTGRFRPKDALPLLLINLTHGTGSEVDRYAVGTLPEMRVKKGAGAEVMYPLYSIDDPKLTVNLPKEQTLYVSIDAVNHATEAATTAVSNPFTRALSIRSVREVAEHLEGAVKNPGDLRHRYHLMHGAMLAGIAIDNSRVHITHLLEHSISALKPEVPHGLGLAVLLPAVLEEIYATHPGVLSEMYRPIAPGVKGGSELAKAVERWLFDLGVKEKLSDLGFSEEDIRDLVENAVGSPAYRGTVNLSPIPFNREIVERIYKRSLYPLTE